MLILGIETSCDETAAALLEISHGRIKILSNIISSQIKLHAKYGGVVPSLAAREHVKNLPKVVILALGKNKMGDVDLISVTSGPGLVSSLLVGTAFAQALAWKNKKPIIGANHLEGHIASNWLTSVGKNSELEPALFPALCLIVSGGHTELLLMTGYGRYKTVGQTLDDAAGEAFDKIARILGLGYPGGPLISKFAEEESKNDISLPRPMFSSKNFDFSFAGLKTAVLYLVRDLLKNEATKKLGRQTRANIAAEAQRAIVDVLVSKTVRAAGKYKVRAIMLSGGVSANKLLRQKLQNATEEKGLKFFRPDMEYTTDNAAMIALAGYFQYKIKKEKSPSLKLRGAMTDWKSVAVDANLTF